MGSKSMHYMQRNLKVRMNMVAQETERVVGQGRDCDVKKWNNDEAGY